MDFGFYPRPYDRTIDNITITTLPELDVNNDFVRSHEWTDRGWISVPHRERVFRLPRTHAISHATSTSNDHLQFLVWCFGFFVGMRMSWTEAGYLDATPIEPNAMSDIVWIGDSLEKAIASADAFWDNHQTNPRIAKVLTGAIHAYFLAQTRGLLEFEQLMYLYMALDACHAAREMIAGRVPHHTAHGKRVKNLCNAFGITADSAGRRVPVWADAAAHAQPAITALRNATLHEGLFFDEPLGFRGFSGPVLDEHVLETMVALVSRLIVALLELPATDYVTSPITMRQNIGVRL